MNKIYDVIIIGGGPAGCTAGLYCARAGLDTLVIEKMAFGGQMCLAHSIENYPGAYDGIDGITLGDKMKNVAERYGATFKTDCVKAIDFTDKIKKINLNDEILYGKTVVISTGAKHKKLGIEKEEQLTGLGVSYCATCDGMFYKNKTVVVVGGGNSALSDALYLSKICKKIYLVHRREALKASKVYINQLKNADNVEIYFNTVLEKLLGENKLKGVITKNVKNSEFNNIKCDGLFICIGRRPETEIFKGKIAIDKGGYIIGDETTKTSAEGVFAVGDVRTKDVRQIVTATADGAVAAHFIEEYLFC